MTVTWLSHDYHMTITWLSPCAPPLRWVTGLHTVSYRTQNWRIVWRLYSSSSPLQRWLGEWRLARPWMLHCGALVDSVAIMSAFYLFLHVERDSQPGYGVNAISPTGINVRLSHPCNVWLPSFSTHTYTHTHTPSLSLSLALHGYPQLQLSDGCCGWSWLLPHSQAPQDLGWDFQTPHGAVQKYGHHHGHQGEQGGGRRRELHLTFEDLSLGQVS